MVPCLVLSLYLICSARPKVPRISFAFDVEPSPSPKTASAERRLAPKCTSCAQNEPDSTKIMRRPINRQLLGVGPNLPENSEKSPQNSDGNAAFTTAQTESHFFPVSKEQLKGARKIFGAGAIGAGAGAVMLAAPVFTASVAAAAAVATAAAAALTAPAWSAMAGAALSGTYALSGAARASTPEPRTRSGQPDHSSESLASTVTASSTSTSDEYFAAQTSTLPAAADTDDFTYASSTATPSEGGAAGSNSTSAPVPNGTVPNASDENVTCPCGFFCDPAAADAPALCPAGSFCPADSVGPSPCEPGFRCPEEGLCEAVACNCSYFCPLPGMEEPLPCPAGSFCDSATNTSCAAFGIPCPGAGPCPVGLTCAEPDPACFPASCDDGYCCNDPARPVPGGCGPAPETLPPRTTVVDRGNFYAAITAVVPGSGLLNPGSGGMVLTLWLQSVDWDSDRPNVTVGGAPCPYLGPLPPPKPRPGAELVVRCRAPELPLWLAGTVEVRVLIASPQALSTGLRRPWLYLPPPAPFLDPSTVAVAGQAGPSLWVANGSAAALSFRVYNVGPGSGRSVLAADLEGAVIDGVSCFQLGYDVIVTLAVLNTGPVDPAAALSLELQQLEAPGQFAVLPLPPVWLEVRDPQLPRVAAAAPSVGAGAAGAIVMLGVTSCADLGRAWVALGAQLQIGDGFAVYGSEVLAVINLANWGLSCGQAGQLVVTAGSFLYGISEDLWFQYQTVCETTYAAAQQAGTADNFLVLLRIPFVDLPSNDELGSIEISVGQTLLSADYLLVMDPVGQGQAVAITQNNDLTSSLAGNVVLAVTVTNFAIVAANDDVLVHFGGTQTPVQRLISSDFQRTRLTLIVPPASSTGVVNVSIFPGRLPTNYANFSFQYIEDDSPIILEFSPELIYSSPGGTEILVTLTRLPVMSLTSVFASIQIGEIIFSNISAQSIVVADDSNTTTVSFLSPASPVAGPAKFFICFDQIFQKTAPFPFEIISLPSTKARVGKLSPSTGTRQGGFWVAVYLVNLRMVTEDDMVLSNVSLKGAWRSETCTIVTTSPFLTKVLFIFPPFDFHGIASIEVWIEGEENFAATVDFLVLDDTIPELIYSFPSIGYVGQNNTINVSVARFSYRANISLIVLPSEAMNGVVTSVLQNLDGSVMFSVNVICLFTSVTENVTIQFCAPHDKCSSAPGVEFPYSCLDPLLPTVLFYTPTSSTVDGLVLLNLTLNWLPYYFHRVSQIQIMMHFFHGKPSIILPLLQSSVESPSNDHLALVGNESSSSMSTSEIVLVFEVPQAPNQTAVDGIELVLEIKDDSSILNIPLPEKFEYTEPLPLIITSVVPTKAVRNVTTPVTISIQNFPKVMDTTDIIVEFYAPNLVQPIFAVVQSFLQQGSSIEIVLQSPVGSKTPYGYAGLTVYHYSYLERLANMSGFLFVDGNSPQVVSMFSENGGVGISSIAVRQSAPTKVTAVIGGVVLKPASVLVGSIAVETTLCNVDVVSNQARATFYVPERDCQVPCDDVYGLIIFSSDCLGCNTSCCKAGNCNEICGSPCQTISACFSLTYFDDTMPSLISQSISEGASSGGTVIKMILSNFPTVVSGDEVSAHFLEQNILGEVVVLVSSESQSEILIVTPEVDLNGSLSVSYNQNILLANSRPSKRLMFPFTFTKTLTSLQSVFPTSGTRSGGVLVFVKLQNFPISSNIGISFGGIEVAQNEVNRLPSSNSLFSTISFKTLASSVGPVTCRIFPKECPYSCGQDVTFQFLQVEEILFLDPLPTSCVLLQSSCELSLRIMNFPTGGAMQVIFRGVDGNTTFVDTKIENTEPIAIAYFNSPTYKQGSFACIVNISSIYANASIQFSLVVYGSAETFIIGVNPVSVPTNYYVSGLGSIQMRTELSIIISNFPDLPLQNIIFTCQGGTGDVVSMEKIPSNQTDSSGVGGLTKIVLVAPASDAPGDFVVHLVQQAEITAGNNSAVSALNSLKFNLSYFYPCAYESFCVQNSLVVDVLKVLQNPPISSICSTMYCIDPSTVSDLELVAVFPSQGPSAGGTLVVLSIRNFPIVSNQSFWIVFGVGVQQIEISASYDNPETEFSAAQDTSQLVFVAPRVPTGKFDELTKVQCAAVLILGSVQKAIPFVFQYTPILQGPSKVLSCYPTTIVSGVNTAVTVSLENFPLLTAANSMDVVSKAVCAASSFREFRGAVIVDSTYLMTTLTVNLNISFEGSCIVQIYSDSYGDNYSGTINIDIRRSLNPVVDYWLPSLGSRGELVTVGISNFEPSLALSDFIAWMNNAGSELRIKVSFANFAGPSNCSTVYCSKFSLGLQLPNITNLPNIMSITIKARGLSSSFDLPLNNNSIPVIEALSPNLLVITEAESTDISLVILNADIFCPDISACEIRFGSKSGFFISSVLRGAQRILTIRAPLLRDDSEIACTIVSGEIALDFCGPDLSVGLKIVPPAIMIEPVDFPCSGGAVITISVIGRSSFEFIDNLPAVFLDSKNCTNVQISRAGASAYSNFSRVVFSTATPSFGAASDSIKGYATINGQNVPFPILLECFEQPIASVVPSMSSLDGSLSSGAEFVIVEVQNFPALSSLKDISLSFGDEVCLGINCSITSFANSASSVALSVTVPKSRIPKVISISAYYLGVELLPAGGNPNSTYRRSSRWANTSFAYTTRSPGVVSVQFCLECNSGPLCIVNDLCGGELETPLSNVMAKSGSGVVFLVLDNVRSIPFNQSSGSLKSPAAIFVSLGTSVGILKRVIYSDHSQLAIEFVASGPLPQGPLSAQVTVKANLSSPAQDIVNFDLDVFDDLVSLKCLSNCSGPSVAGPECLLRLTGYKFSSQSFSELITVRFGELLAPATRFIEYNQSGNIIAVSPPNYTCSNCLFNSGNAKVILRLLYTAESSEIARISYTFWGPPRIETAIFNSAGTSILISFDQPTNRASMNGTFSNCTYLFEENGFGIGPDCSWQADDQITILLGDRPSIIPGSKIQVKRSALLRSSNEISPSSTAMAVVSAPSLVPELIISGVTVVDLCSPLEIRAYLPSPRPVVYSWSCLNDAVFDAYLGSVSGPVLSLDSGTPQMQSSSMTYTIAVSARSFLSSSSKTATINVLKQSGPAPPVQFIPSTLSTTRDKGVLVSGLPDFSSCPAAQDNLAFEWYLVSGPYNTAFEQILSSKVPQIYIPSMILIPGSTYVFGLSTKFRQDASIRSESSFTLTVAYQPLVATIMGMSTLHISFDSDLSLSAAGSFDPDSMFDSVSVSEDALSFAWSCTISSLILGGPCRDRTGRMLIFSQNSTLQVLAGTLSPSSTPYIFQVSVSKPTKQQATASVQVYVVSTQISIVTANVSCFQSSTEPSPCCAAQNGAILANSESKFLLSSSSNSENASFEWTLLSSVPIVISQVLVSVGQDAFILQGSALIFIPGNTYFLKLTETSADLSNSGAERSILINYPPTGGNFSACNQNSISGSCVTTGLSLLDTFMFTCSSWTDPESDTLLFYRFGYTVQNASANLSKTFWFDWTLNSIKYLSLPSGVILAMGQVQDACGGQTSVMSSYLYISDSEQVAVNDRRLLVASNFWNAAVAKVQTALQTFRPDNINELVTSLSFEISKLATGTTDMVLYKEILMQALEVSVGQTILTNGYVCEALNTAASLTSNYKELSPVSIITAANIVDILSGPTIDGSFAPLNCAEGAANIVADIFRAVSLGSWSLTTNQSLIYTLITGINRFATQILQGCAIGERCGFGVESEIMVIAFRSSVADLQSSFSKMLPPASLFPGAAIIKTPNSFIEQMSATDILDVQYATYAQIPLTENFSLMTGLYSLWIGLANSRVVFKTLSEPIQISIFVNLDISDERTISESAESQLACVQWNNITYSNGSCKLSAVSAKNSENQLLVTCSCWEVPITMMAIALKNSFLKNSSLNSLGSSTASLTTGKNLSGHSTDSKVLPDFQHKNIVSSIDEELVLVQGNPSTMHNLVLYVVACIAVLTMFAIFWIRGILVVLKRMEIKKFAQDSADDEKNFASDLVIICRE